MNIFGYNYIVTNSGSWHAILSNNSYFQPVWHDNGIYAFSVMEHSYKSHNALLTTSAYQLAAFIDFHKTVPIWLYSPYLYSYKTLINYFTNYTVYAPNYYTKYEFFLHMNGISLLVPAEYTSNSFYTNRWEIGYLPGGSQETWSQNLVNINKYQYQNDINTNYGVVYSLYNHSKMNIHYNLNKGSYVAIGRVLKSNRGGSMNIAINGKLNKVDTYSSNMSYFTYMLLGNVSSNGNILLNLTNGIGLNAINAIIFVPNELYHSYINQFSSFISKIRSPSSIKGFNITNKYDIQLSTKYNSNQINYDQFIIVSNSTVHGINSNWSNMVFEYKNGTIIPSFIEYINRHTAGIWLKLNGDVNRTIHLFIFNKSENVMSPLSFLGEAPALSPVYGEYFNAPLVFGKGNAWDWADSYQGWNVLNSSATFLDNGVHVYKGMDGGIYFNKNITGMAFSLYGWTMNSTVIQLNILDNGNVYGYGFVGTLPYALQEYPVFTNNINVYGGQNKFYLFTISAFTNGTMISTISNSTFSRSYYPINYTGIKSTYSIILRESMNNPQYYEYGFLRTLPLNNVMPSTQIIEVKS